MLNGATQKIFGFINLGKHYRLIRCIGLLFLLIVLSCAISYSVIPGRASVFIEIYGLLGIDLIWVPITSELDYESSMPEMSFLIPWSHHWPQEGHSVSIRADGVLMWDIIPNTEDCEPQIASPMTVHKALKIGDVDTAMAMLKADPDLIHSQDEHYYKTPLHIAADLGYVSITEWLLQHGADVNAKAYNDFSPLHLSESGTIARILIEHGADLDQVDSLGNTPLQKAAMRDKKEIIEAILETGYPMDLRSALMLGERERALELVKSNPIILTTQTEGWSLWGNTSPLGIAADQGDLEMVKIFLANGAPVNSTTYMPNRGNATPLTNAVWGGHIEVVKTLCANGADPDIASGGKFYRTVLDYAIVSSEPKMIWALIECGARPNEDLWEHIAERCSYIMREKRAILLGAGIATVSAIAVSVINRRRRKQVTYR